MLEGDEKLTTDTLGLQLQQRSPTMAPSAKAKRLPNFKLLHEREQARVERFKVRARALAALSRTNVLCSAQPRPGLTAGTCAAGTDTRAPLGARAEVLTMRCTCIVADL